MTRRLEVGPLLVALGGALLLVSLFLDWFEGGITAWEAFEVWDVVLGLLGGAAVAVAVALVLPELGAVDRRWFAPLVGAVVIVVASQIINPPPAATGQDPETGSWLALAAALLMLLGAVLTLGRVSFAVTVEGRDTRRRVAAVDARDPTTSESGPLFSRSPAEERAGAVAAPPPPADTADETVPLAEPADEGTAGEEPPDEPGPRPGRARSSTRPSSRRRS
jgi:hypothetical protein